MFRNSVVILLIDIIKMFMWIELWFLVKIGIIVVKEWVLKIEW